MEYQELLEKGLVPEEFKYHFLSFVYVNPEFHKDIEEGTQIRYITEDGEYRAGGFVIVNKYPEYLVLKSGKNNFTWSIGFNKNIIFLKSREKLKKENVQKDNLWSLYLAGFVQIHDKPIFNEDNEQNNPNND